MKPASIFRCLGLSLLLGFPAQAATTLISDDFETSLGGWTAAAASSGRYVHTTALQPADDLTTNFATGTSGTNFTTGGSAAASIGKGGGTLTSAVLDLSSGGSSETITVSFDFVLHNGTSTRRSYVQYSNDNGGSWFTVAMMQLGAGGASANKVSYDGSVTFTEGSSTVVRTGAFAAPVSFTGMLTYAGAAFTNQSLIRIINLSSAGADARLFVDNIAVVSSIPEPRAALLGGIGLLLMLRRRRA